MDAESVLAAHGLIGPFTQDGELHRCATRSKPRKENGWYIIYDGGLAVHYGDWQNGDETIFWKDENHTISPATKSKGESLRTLRETEQLKLADDALTYYEGAAVTGYSDYLARKNISHPLGLRFDGTTLVMPLQDAQGKVWSYQRVLANGDKYFMRGGRVRGCYYLIGTPGARVIVCEGFATGAAIHQATGLAVVVALNAGNLKPVCDSLPYTSATSITIAADNDKSLVGETAARESGYDYVIPVNIGEDFSDIYLRDPNEVRDYFIASAAVTATIPIAHGLVGEIADWITATAIRPQPLLSLAAALSFVGLLKGHRVRGYTDLRTNLLILAMAPTAGGKEHPQNCLKRLAKACGLQKHLMGEAVSGAGFLNGLKNANNVGLMVMDEVGRYIGNLSSSSAGIHQREIIDYIIKTFSCANSMLMGREKAAAAKEPRIDIDQPHFCCYGSTVYEKFRDACGSSEIVDGFLNRWLVFQSADRPARQQKVKFGEPPKELIEHIMSATSISPYDSYGNPHPRELRFTPEAWTFFLTYRGLVDAMVEKAPYPMNQLYSRTTEHVEKIAHTLSDSEWTDVRDVKAAIAIVEHSNAAIKEFAGMLADNVQERDYVRVREIIKENGEITRSFLLRRCQFVQGGARRLSEIIAVLVDDNIISQRESCRKVIYRWIKRF